jgi:DNA adenine methylase
MGELAEFPGWNAHDDFAAIARGEETVDGERVRHYVGTGYVAPTTTRLILTEQGEAFLNPPAPIGAGSMGSLGDGDGGQRPSNGAETSGMDVTAGETASSEAITGTALGSNWPGVQRTPCDSVTAGETAPDFAQTMAAEPSGDWPELFKAAHELAWREPVKVTVTEIQASLLDFGKVYAPGRKVERPILRWHGGKWRLAPWIISHFPTHKVYIEPFGGAGSVLLQKLPAITEVWNDLEGEVVNLFRVLRSNAEDLARLIYLTPFAREEYHSLYEVMDDPLERARQFVARSFMGQSSKGALWKSGFDSRINPDGFASRLNSLRAMPEEFHAIAERFRGVIIEQRPADAIFAQYDRQDVLFYVDPPYLSDRAKHYTHELDEAGHVALLETLRSLAGMVVLSGYRSELYDAALTDWRRIETDAHADGGIDRTEVLWLNPACVAALDAQHPQLFDLASIDAVNTPPRT